MKIKYITYLLYKKPTCLLYKKPTCFKSFLIIWLFATVQTNHPLCSNGSNNRELHIDWFNVLVNVFLGNDVVCIPVFKFTLEKLLGSFNYTDIQWLQPVSAVEWDDDIH